MNAINLIPQGVRDKAAVRRRVVRWSVAVSGIACVLTVACVVLRTVGGDERSRLESDSDRIAERLGRAETALGALRKQVSEANQKLEASKTIGVHPDWSTLLRALAALRGDEVMLTAVDIKAKEQAEPEAAAKPAAGTGGKAATSIKSKAKPKRKECYTLQIKGRGLSQMAVLEFVKRVEDLGLMAEVSPPQTRAEPYLGVAGVSFDMECRLSERAAAQATAGAGVGGGENPR